jgi:hypothetical protein
MSRARVSPLRARTPRRSAFSPRRGQRSTRACPISARYRGRHRRARRRGRSGGIGKANGFRSSRDCARRTAVDITLNPRSTHYPPKWQDAAGYGARGLQRHRHTGAEQAADAIFAGASAWRHADQDAGASSPAQLSALTSCWNTEPAGSEERARRATREVLMTRMEGSMKGPWFCALFTLGSLVSLAGCDHAIRLDSIPCGAFIP